MTETAPSAAQRASERRALWGQQNDDYGRTFFDRAIGHLPEMESSKATAARLRDRVRGGDRILDVACGAGHYLRSLRSRIDVPFSYTGLDGAHRYASLGREAFAEDLAASFVVGNAFHLPFPDAAFDIVMCNNALLHLPSIDQPVSELLRVARRFVLVRTLVGHRSFRVQDVVTQDQEFVDGEPRDFHWYNIYSESHVRALLGRDERVASVRVELDREYDSARIAANAEEQRGAPDATGLLAGWQVNGYLLLPWSFVEVDLSPD